MLALVGATEYHEIQTLSFLNSIKMLPCMTIHACVHLDQKPFFFNHPDLLEPLPPLAHRVPLLLGERVPLTSLRLVLRSNDDENETFESLLAAGISKREDDGRGADRLPVDCFRTARR